MAEEKGLLDTNQEIVKIEVETYCMKQECSVKAITSEVDFEDSIANKTVVNVFKMHMRNLCEFPGYNFEPGTSFFQKIIGVVRFATLPLILLLIR